MNKWSVNWVSSQTGKIAIVTGANSGIGYEVSLELVKKDIEVIMACRNMEKAEKRKLTYFGCTPKGK